MDAELDIDPTRWVTDDTHPAAQGVGLWDLSISPYRLIGCGLLPHDGPSPETRAKALRDYVLAACLAYHAAGLEKQAPPESPLQ